MFVHIFCSSCKTPCLLICFFKFTLNIQKTNKCHKYNPINIHTKKKEWNSLNKEKSRSLLLGFLLSFLGLWLLLFFGSSGFFFKLFQSIHGHLGSCGNAGGELVGSSCEWNLASSTLPDSQWKSSHWGLHYHNKCTFPHAGQTYLACCWSSNFLTIFLIAPPYLVPYFPTIPTFLVLLAIVDKNNWNIIN